MSHESATTLLSLRLFGNPAVFALDKDITPSLSKRSVLLLAFLALRKGQAMERQALAGILWPDSADAAALHNLRQTLAALKRELGAAKGCLLAPTPRTLALNATSSIAVDVLTFDQLCREGSITALEKAVELHGDLLLPGCEEPFAVSERERRQQTFISAAEKLSGHYLESGELERAIRTLRKVLASDPYRESACHSLMKALALEGDSAGAMEAFREFRRRLRQDLKALPTEEIQDLYRSIRSGKSLVGQPERTASRVPVAISTLIGRRTELKEVLDVLDRCRLVTLTGPGGVGKTRLSLAIADVAKDQSLDGAWFIDLAPLRDRPSIEMAIASALDIQPQVDRPLSEILAYRLADRELLLVLDNCEHVIEPVARLIEPLLSAAKRLHVLATSRQSIGVRGEAVWPVPALATPGPEDDPASILQCDAVRLFLERSALVKGDKVPNGKQLRAIASLCRRLDGLPLAIELAAARTNILTPADIEARLDDRFSVLTGGNVTPGRHQTLRTSMEWSWDLLSRPEQSLLMKLSVFRGGSSYAAIEKVAADASENLLDLLSALVDRSLVKTVEGSEGIRYTLLETVREFADEKLGKSGQWDKTHDRHRDYFLSWAEESYHPMDSVKKARRLAAFEVDHDNFRAAISWCHTRKDGAKLIRLCAALSSFWDTHGHLNEGRLQLEAALKVHAPDLPVETRGRALVHAGWMATVQDDPHAAIRYYEEGLAIARSRGDRHALGVITNCLSNAHIRLGNFSEAEVLLQESLEIKRSFGDRYGVAMILCNLAEIPLENDDLRKAKELVVASLREMGEPSPEHASTSGTVLRHLAHLAYRDGDHLQARGQALEAIKFFKNAALLVEIPFAVMTLAFAEWGLGEKSRAVHLLSMCQKISTAQGTPPPGYLSRAQTEILKQTGSSGAHETDGTPTIERLLETALQATHAREGSEALAV